MPLVIRNNKLFICDGKLTTDEDVCCDCACDDPIDYDCKCTDEDFGSIHERSDLTTTFSGDITLTGNKLGRSANPPIVSPSASMVTPCEEVGIWARAEHWEDDTYVGMAIRVEWRLTGIEIVEIDLWYYVFDETSNPYPTLTQVDDWPVPEFDQFNARNSSKEWRADQNGSHAHWRWELDTCAEACNESRSVQKCPSSPLAWNTIQWTGTSGDIYQLGDVAVSAQWIKL